jgi:hypothetical protein
VGRSNSQLSASPSNGPYSFSSGSFDEIPDFDALASDDKENVQPAMPGSFGGATPESQGAPVSVTRLLPSGPLLELEFTSDGPQGAIDDDAEMVVESDDEDVDPQVWSEGLAEKLEERVRSNADAMYDFVIFEDPMGV